MDIINKLAMEVFNNKESYTTNDYLTIMNILKEQYHRINGTLEDFSNEKEEEVELCDICGEEAIYEDCYCSYCYYDRSDTYSNTDGYLSDYIEPY